MPPPQRGEGAGWIGWLADGRCLQGADWDFRVFPKAEGSPPPRGGVQLSSWPGTRKRPFFPNLPSPECPSSEKLPPINHNLIRFQKGVYQGSASSVVPTSSLCSRRRLDPPPEGSLEKP